MVSTHRDDIDKVIVIFYDDMSTTMCTSSATKKTTRFWPLFFRFLTPILLPRAVTTRPSSMFAFNVFQTVSISQYPKAHPIYRKQTWI